MKKLTLPDYFYHKVPGRAHPNAMRKLIRREFLAHSLRLVPSVATSSIAAGTPYLVEECKRGGRKYASATVTALDFFSAPIMRYIAKHKSLPPDLPLPGEEVRVDYLFFLYGDDFVECPPMFFYDPSKTLLARSEKFYPDRNKFLNNQTGFTPLLAELEINQSMLSYVSLVRDLLPREALEFMLRTPERLRELPRFEKLYEVHLGLFTWR